MVESWLTFEKDKALEFEGYKSHAIYRTDQVGGGVKLHYLNHINVTVISEYAGVFESCECIIAKATDLPVSLLQNLIVIFWKM